MFPTPDEIREYAEIELAYMKAHGFDHGEIELFFPQYATKVRVIVRNGKLEYAKVTEHPKGILPNISLKPMS